MAGKLAVIGAGLMGSGIAQVAAQAGWEVVLRDVTDEALARGTDGIKASYDKFVSKGKLDAADAEAALGRITPTTDLDAAADADIVVEAVKLYESGVATAEDIDLACKLGFGHAMGPLATTDLTGVDILLHATGNIYTESQDEKFAPPEVMRRMVDAGDIGRKSGQGFYTY